MKRSLFVLAFALSACGPAPSNGPGFNLQLAVTAGLLNDISSFQVALVTDNTTIDCVAAQDACIKDQVAASRFVKLKDSTGAQRNALVFPIDLVVGSPNTQDLTLRDVPLGRQYALVVEALSKTDPPQLAGSACTYVNEVKAGTNPTAVATIKVHSPAVSCDPRIP